MTIDIFETAQTKRICANCRRPWWQCKDRIKYILLSPITGWTLESCGPRFDSIYIDERLKAALKQIQWARKVLDINEKVIKELLGNRRYLICKNCGAIVQYDLGKSVDGRMICEGCGYANIICDASVRYVI